MHPVTGSSGVALLAEGVDRNANIGEQAVKTKEVALLAEGVDRNQLDRLECAGFVVSPSSRRAWIEIS